MMRSRIRELPTVFIIPFSQHETTMPVFASSAKRCGTAIVTISDL
jgi:hypothetical protein